MLDFLMIAVTAGFFAACLAYMAGCERLDRQPAPVPSRVTKDLAQRPRSAAREP